MPPRVPTSGYPTPTDEGCNSPNLGAPISCGCAKPPTTVQDAYVPDGGEGCKASGPGGASGSGAGGTCQQPSGFTADGGEGCQTPQCPPGSPPGYRLSPANALDRAQRVASLGNGYMRQALQDLQQIGSGCGVRATVNLGNGNVIVQTGPPRAGAFDPWPGLTYNSDESTQSEYGYGWTNMLLQYVSIVSATAVDVAKGSGRVNSYTGLSGGVYVTPGDANNKLVKNGDNTYTETQPDGFTLNYETSGRLSHFANGAGQRWSLSYDAGNRITKVTDPFNRLTTFQYDASNRINTIVDTGGRATVFKVDGSGDLVEITSPELCVTSLVYSGHDLIAYVNAEQQRTSYAYDGSSPPRLRTITWPTGGVTTLAYSTNRTVVTEPGNRVTTLNFTSGGKLLTSVENPLGDTTAANTSLSRMSAAIDPRGNRATFTYETKDSVQRQTAITLPRGGIYSYIYDNATGLIDAVVEPNSARTTIIWNTTDKTRTALQDPFGHRTSFTYNSAGQIETIQDAKGFVTTRIYDARGNQIAEDNPLGQRTSFSYNGNGLRTATTDALGNITTQVYDDVNRLVATIDPLNRRTSFAYNQNGQLLTTSEPPGRVTTNQYDTAGRLQTIKDPLGHVTTLGYDTNHRFRTTENALGRVTTTVYDNAERVIATVDALGNRTSFGYDAFGNPTATTNPLGQVTTTQYDAENRPSATIDPLDKRTSFGYDLSGNQITIQDPLGNVITSVYDAAQRLLATEDPFGFRTTYAYDQLGLLASVRDAKGNYTTSVYDAAQRLIAQIDPLGHRHSFTFDAAGRRIESIDQLNQVTTTVYNGAGQPLVMVDPLGNRVTFGYDAAGNQETVQDPFNNVTSQVFDAKDQRIATIDPLGNRTSFSYDSLGQTIAVQDANGKRTTTFYDEVQRPLATLNPLGHYTSFAYDAAGRQTKLTDALNHVVSFGYDVVGRQTLMIDSVGNRFSSTYDTKGRLESTLDGRDVRITLTYDAMDRWTLKNRSDGVRITQTYDSLGNRRTMVDPRGTTSFTVDALSRLVTVTNPDGKAIDYDYDTRSLRAGMRDPDGGRFTYSYDNASRITSLQNPQNERTTWSYDKSRRSGVLLANGVRTSFSFDAANRLVTIIHSKSDNTVLSQFDYQYDGAGNRTSVLEASGVRTTWTYDDANQLIRERRSGSPVFDITHTYDAVGNQLVKNDLGSLTTFAYDAANQLSNITTGGVFTMTYDAAGNTTAAFANDPVARWTLTWDAENRLAFHDSNILFGGRVSYTYDGDGRRVRFQTQAATTKFVWDLENVLLETDGANATQNVYTLEPAGFGNLVSARRGGVSSYLLFDALGSTDRVVNAAQAVIDQYVYEAFGNLRNAPSTSNPFRWVGQLGYYFDNKAFAEYYVRARYYSTATARWVGRDHPFTRFATYNYGNNSPTVYVDPSGHVPIICHCETVYDRHIIEIYKHDVEVNCSGMGDKCCRDACPGEWTWDLKGACPSNSSGPLQPCSYSECIGRCQTAEDYSFAVCTGGCRILGPLSWECIGKCASAAAVLSVSCRLACNICTDP